GYDHREHDILMLCPITIHIQPNSNLSVIDSAC
ncbi:unnamed protein product, partial [marine sediment metagenome]